MHKFKFSTAIDSILKLCVCAALILAIVTNQKYDYYTLLRWIVMITFIYFGFRCINKNKFGLIIFFVAVAIMFNPFHKFVIKKGTWHKIDYIVAIILILTIIYDWILVIYKKENKKKI